LWREAALLCPLCRRSGRLGVDFSRFDSTAPRSGSATPPGPLSSLPSGLSGSFASAAAAAVQQQQQAAPPGPQQPQAARLAAAAGPHAPGPAAGMQRHSTTTFGAQAGADLQASPEPLT
jgi:hypothetical protein